MNIDGKQIANEIKNNLKERVKHLSQKTRLDIVYAGKNPLIENFLRTKRRMGEDIGVETRVHYFPSAVSQKTLVEEIQKIASDKNSSGVLVQLPLPVGLDTETILNTLPPEKDIDVLSEKSSLLFAQGNFLLIPPVIGAVAEILTQNNLTVADKNAVVIGNGRLVGKPAAIWLKQKGAQVTVLDKTTDDLAPFLKKADIIISGAGSPGIIQPEMIRDGVLLFDAGASEEAGIIKGDADNACSDKCAIFTPVPGGIGPITVVLLFKNLLDMAEKEARR